MAPSSTSVAAAVTAAHATYLASNQKSAQLHKDAAQHMPGGNTRTVLYAEPFPIAIESGAGNKLTSVDGRVYTDFLGEFSAGLFGHSHDRIAEAVQTTLRSGWNYGGESVCEKKFAAKVTERFAAGGVELIRFTNSGTEANTFAIGAALEFTRRKKIVVFSDSYHGGTFVFPMDLCRWMHNGSVGDAPCRTMNLPHDFVAAPYNNLAETAAIIDALPKDSLAAILLEPVQGSGGCRPATPEFLRYLRDTCDNLGALLIMDEVMSSRLGTAGALASVPGETLKADLITFGKWVGGGMTFGAFGGRRDIMSLFDPALSSARRLMHPGTYNNNAFTMNAGLAALDIFNAEAVDDLNARGNLMKKGITEALFETGLYNKEYEKYLRDVLEVDSFEGESMLYTGKNSAPARLPTVFLASRGSMLNLRFTGPNAGYWHNIYYLFMLEKGIYMASRGYTALNLVITDEDVAAFVAAVKEFLEKYKGDLSA